MRDARLFFLERARCLITQRLHQIRKRCALAGVNKCFDRHARHQFDGAQPGNLFGAKRDTNGVIANSGSLILGEVGGNQAYLRLQFPGYCAD